MPTRATFPPADATIQEAKQFAESVAALVRDKLRTLPEQKTLAFLDALNDKVEFELWVARMELESIPGCDDEHTTV